MTTFMMAVAYLSFVVLLSGVNNQWQRLLALLTFGASLAASVATGSRWGVYIWAVLLLVILPLYGKRLLTSKVLAGVFLIVISIAVVFTVVV